MMSLIVSKNLIVPEKYTKRQGPQERQNQTGFGGLGDVATSVIKTVDTNDLINYVLLDTVSMIGPRTIIDGSRNPYAGMETLARESFGAVSMCIMPGFVAMGLASLAGKFNNPTGVKTNLFARNNVVDHLYENSWEKAKSVGKDQRLDDYIKNALKDLHVDVGNKATKMDNVNFLENAIGADGKKLAPDAIITKMKELITHATPEKTGISTVAKELADAVGESSSFSLKSSAGKNIGTSAEHFVRDVVTLGREVFHKYDLDNMSGELKTKLDKSGIPAKKAMERAIARLKAVSTFKTVATFGLISGLCFSFQFINRAITKAKTGKEGFVGYSDFGADGKKAETQDKSIKTNKTENKASASSKQDGKKQQLSFKGGWIDPAITGPYAGAGFFRGVYPLTIMGRLAAARDGNEFRETLVRDVLGYTNWLILGGVTAKLVGDALSGGMLIKGNKAEGFLDKAGAFFKSEIMSHNDISAYVENLKRQGADPLIKQAKKILKPEFIEKNIKDTKKIGEALLQSLNHRKEVSWVTGFVWSTAMLGIIVPKYNAYVTEKKRKAQLAEQQKNVPQPEVKTTHLDETMNKFLKRNKA
jgi:hypothetical protein